MRHRGFLSNAADVCSYRSRQTRHTPRVQVAQSNVAGPSRLPSSGLTSSSSPSPFPPPIHSPPSSSPVLTPPSSTAALSPTTPLAHTFNSATSSSFPLSHADGHLQSSSSQAVWKTTTTRLPLSFLYPPSCFDVLRDSSSVVCRRPKADRHKSSLAPTRAVSAAAAAPQLAPAEDDRDHLQHLLHQLEPDFTFISHNYEPLHPIINHPRSSALLQQDAAIRPEDEGPEQLADHGPVTSMRSSDSLAASAAALASLRRQSDGLQQLLQAENAMDSEMIARKCRRLVLQACRVQSRLHARKARALAYETTSACALHLAAAGQSLTAGNIIRYLLVKLRWNPRFGSDSEQSQTPLTATTLAHVSDKKATSGFGAPTAGSRLALAAQQVISQLTLAPSTSGARPTRGFPSPQHLDVAASLVSAMHLTHLPRSTASQTALIRAMIASGHTRFAIETYAAEVRAWWNAHKEAKRPKFPLRRQAALVAEFGKPSSQVLREITRALQNLEAVLSRVQADFLSGLSQRERQYLSSKRAEYADSLVVLIRLVRGGRLPLPSTPSVPEITWILSACCRFETTVLLHEPSAQDASMPGSFDAAEKGRLGTAAKVIRYYLREYMQSLPDGQTRSAGTLLIKGEPVVRPAIGIGVYNQLIHYALSVLKSASICKHVFQHMTQLRQPPLQPDAVTFNTILRQATTQRYQALARAVLTTTHAEQSQSNASERPSTMPSIVLKQPAEMGVVQSASAASPAASATSASAPDVAPCPVKPLIQQIDAAIAQADSYRLVSLLQYVTASGLFLRSYRHEPGHAGVLEVVMRIYPALNTKRFARRAVAQPLVTSRQMVESRLRPKANQASRYAILDPHVLTATLNLAAKAGKTGLALRVWRLLKRTSLQSAVQSPTADVAKTPWKVPVAAATVLMQVLANEAAKVPKVKHALRSRRLRSPRDVARGPTRRSSQRMGLKQYAKGWNITASLRGHSHAGRRRSLDPIYDTTGELGEGLRWRAAQLVAKREYAFVVHHWQLSGKLRSWRRKRVEGWMQSGLDDASVTAQQCASPELVDGDDPQPDSRFYDALLNVFGHRPGMIQRGRGHVSRSEVLSQLRRGYKQAADKAVSSAVEKRGPTYPGLGVPASVQATESDDNTVPNQVLPAQTCVAAATDSLSPESGSDATKLLGNAATNQLLQAAVSRVSWNSRGRYTSLQPDPFLVRILLDMEALSLNIPVGYRWVLTHCWITATQAQTIPELLQNEQGGRRKKSVGPFSPWRGPRIKTVGMVARRPNMAAAAMKATVKEQDKKGGRV